MHVPARMVRREARSIRSVWRRDTPEYPEEAVREAAVSAGAVRAEVRLQRAGKAALKRLDAAARKPK